MSLPVVAIALAVWVHPVAVAVFAGDCFCEQVGYWPGIGGVGSIIPSLHGSICRGCGRGLDVGSGVSE